MSKRIVPTFDIIQYPASILMQPCKQVTTFDAALEQTIQRMRPTMHDAIGVGLASTQINSPYSFAVIEFRPGKNDDPDEIVPFHAIINPKILEYGDEQDEMEEGCLSCPGIEVKIRRATTIRVRAQDIDGREYEQTIDGFAARIYQHEIDHLNGLLILDRAHGQKALLEAYRANPKTFADKVTSAHTHSI